MANSARTLARQAGDHPIVEAGARLGYAASGVLHLVLAWLALQLSFGSSSNETDQNGALRALAGTPMGAVILWVLFAGFLLLGLWELTEVVSRPGMKKVKAGAKAIVYLVLAGSTLTVLMGTPSNSNTQTQTLTATVMAHPAGIWAIGLVGAAVVGIGVFHLAKGARASFLKDFRQRPPRPITILGRVGYIAKGIALLAVGGLFIAAALSHDPNKAGGLDAGLRSLLSMPAGPALLTGVAVGLACYGIYSIARAGYARV